MWLSADSLLMDVVRAEEETVDHLRTCPVCRPGSIEPACARGMDAVERHVIAHMAARIYLDEMVP